MSMSKTPMVPMFRVLMSEDAPRAVASTIESGTITEGPRVKELERRLGKVLGLQDRPVLAVNSGTSALHLAMTLLDLAPGDEVISTPITCAATSCAIRRAGGEIVWADVDPRTGRLDARDVARRVTSRTRAVVCVDWGGALCDVAALSDAVGADEKGSIPVIEDAAHAFGAAREDPPPGAVCWSFQAIKHLTTGDGGALFVRDARGSERARALRWFGIDRDAPGPHIDKPIGEAGFKYHMNDLAAAIGIANLPLAVAAVERHRANAAWYGDALRGVPGIRLPSADPGSAWWLYTLILEPDDAQRGFAQFMAARGVECSRVHARNDAHRAFGEGPVDLPGVAYFDGHQIAIPVGWWVGDETRARVAEAVRAWARDHA